MLTFEIDTVVSMRRRARGGNGIRMKYRTGAVGTGLLMMFAWSLPVGVSRAAVLPAPQSTAALKLRCGAQNCARTVLGILNNDRRQAGVAPLALTVRQSTGIAGCAGSFGHSAAMARSGAIWHINVRFPNASFPHNLCVSYSSAGENVGDSGSGNPAQDLQILDRLMISEPHSAVLCSTEANHACNILNPAYHRVGIGVYLAAGTTWLTEDFVS